LRALARLAEGKPAEAIPLLEPVTFDAQHTDELSIWTIAHLLTRDWPAAIKGLTFLVDDKSVRDLSAMRAFAMVSLARAQAEAGNRDEARRRYQAFFEFWKDADPDVPLLVQARDEFAKLGS
jgi:hypothetical protein